MLQLAMPFRHKKEFGQHFLRQVPKELLFPIDALEKHQSLQIPATIHIIEIGPGEGVVTEAVIQQILPFQKLRIHYQVIDIDAEALTATKQRIELLKLPQRVSLEYTHQDVLRHQFSQHNKANFLFIFGSLPYNISKKIVNATKQFLLELMPPIAILPSRFMLQAEVADDYASQPPSAAYLGTELSLWAEKRKISKRVPPGAFIPPPAVDSAVLEVEWKQPTELRQIPDLKKISAFLRLGFTARRKVVASIFKKKIPPAQVTPTLNHLLSLRAHELSMGEWMLIFQALPS